MARQIVETEPTRRGATRPLDPELETLARWMDSTFQIPGWGIRFGWDALLGLIPGVGDTISAIISLYILGAARRYDVSKITLLRMAGNIALDYVVGSLPLLGDVFDVYWKANQKNVALLQRDLLSPTTGRRGRPSDWLFVGSLILGLILLLAGALTVAWWLVTGLAQWVLPK